VDSELSVTAFIKMTQPAQNVMSRSNSVHVNPDLLGPRGPIIDSHTVLPPTPEPRGSSTQVNGDMLGPRGPTIYIHHPTVIPPFPEMGTRGGSTQINGDMQRHRGPTIDIHPPIIVLPPTGPNTQDLLEPSL